MEDVRDESLKNHHSANSEFRPLLTNLIPQRILKANQERRGNSVDPNTGMGERKQFGKRQRTGFWGGEGGRSMVGRRVVENMCNERAREPAGA